MLESSSSGPFYIFYHPSRHFPLHLTLSSVADKTSIRRRWIVSCNFFFALPFCFSSSEWASWVAGFFKPFWSRMAAGLMEPQIPKPAEPNGLVLVQKSNPCGSFIIRVKSSESSVLHAPVELDFIRHNGAKSNRDP